MESNGRVAEENEKKPDIPRTSSQQQKYSAKATKILEACKWRDIETLRSLATSEGGLLSDDLRRQACSYYQPISLNQD
jgi:TBC1 domain family member 20